MIEKARATGLYAGLEVTDMLEGLRSAPDSRADLLLAADAMVYVADLSPVLQQIRVLAPGGLLAFTWKGTRARLLSWARAGATRMALVMCARRSMPPDWLCCSLNSNRSVARQARPCRAL